MVAQGLSILERLIDPSRGDFTPGVARYFLSIDFSPEQHALYDSLSSKASTGTLSETEASALDELIAANGLLTVLQSKARVSMCSRTPAA